MNRPPITAKRVLIGLTLALVILSQLPVRAATWISYLPHSFVSLISQPAVLLTRASTTLRPPRDDTDEVIDDKDLKHKYAEALAYIDNLEQQIIELRNLSESLTKIDQLLQLEDIQMAGASVIGFNGDKENPILTINIGSDDEVRDGLAVVWGANLVGEVVSTSAKTSDVKLITAADTGFQVRFAGQSPDGSTNTLTGYLEVGKDGRSFYTEAFSVDDPVNVGDLVFLADDTWQSRAKGFIVGAVEVAEPHPDRPYLNKLVVVRPMMDLAHLPRVVVLVPRN